MANIFLEDPNNLGKLFNSWQPQNIVVNRETATNAFITNLTVQNFTGGGIQDTFTNLTITNLKNNNMTGNIITTTNSIIDDGKGNEKLGGSLSFTQILITGPSAIIIPNGGIPVIMITGTSGNSISLPLISLNPGLTLKVLNRNSGNVNVVSHGGDFCNGTGSQFVLLPFTAQSYINDSSNSWWSA
jgi:hypothetical protein